MAGKNVKKAKSVDKVIESKVVKRVVNKWNTNLVTTDTTFFTKSKSGITLQEARDICVSMNEKVKNEKGYRCKFLMTGQTITSNAFNIKSYEEKLPRYETIEEYLDGRVMENTKFENMFSVTIHMVREKIVD